MSDEVQCPDCGEPTPWPATACERCGSAISAAGRAPSGPAWPDASTLVERPRRAPSAAAGGASAPRSDVAPGEVLRERYELRERLGTGGMGEVWAAWDLLVREDVAIKLMHAHLGEEIPRFLREGRLSRSLNHPNVVRTMNIESDGRLHYIVMELLRGANLRDWTASVGPHVARRFAFSVADQVLAALEAAHEVGIVHRDIKPPNVWMTEATGGYLVKLMDFGLAKPIQTTDVGLTQAMMIVGTPAYMAPEQKTPGAPVDHRTDLYATALILHELYMGSLPLRHQVLSEEVPAPLRELLSRALHFLPEERFQGAGAMRHALWDVAALLQDDPGSAGLLGSPTTGPDRRTPPPHVRTPRPRPATTTPPPTPRPSPPTPPTDRDRTPASGAPPGRHRPRRAGWLDRDGAHGADRDLNADDDDFEGEDSGLRAASRRRSRARGVAPPAGGGLAGLAAIALLLGVLLAVLVAVELAVRIEPGGRPGPSELAGPIAGRLADIDAELRDPALPVHRVGRLADEMRALAEKGRRVEPGDDRWSPHEARASLLARVSRAVREGDVAAVGRLEEGVVEASDLRRLARVRGLLDEAVSRAVALERDVDDLLRRRSDLLPGVLAEERDRLQGELAAARGRLPELDRWAVLEERLRQVTSDPGRTRADLEALLTRAAQEREVGDATAVLRAAEVRLEDARAAFPREDFAALDARAGRLADVLDAWASHDRGRLEQLAGGLPPGDARELAARRAKDQRDGEAAALGDRVATALRRGALADASTLLEQARESFPEGEARWSELEGRLRQDRRDAAELARWRAEVDRCAGGVDCLRRLAGDRDAPAEARTRARRAADASERACATRLSGLARPGPWIARGPLEGLSSLAGDPTCSNAQHDEARTAAAVLRRRLDDDDAAFTEATRNGGEQGLLAYLDAPGPRTEEHDRAARRALARAVWSSVSAALGQERLSPRLLDVLGLRIEEGSRLDGGRDWDELRRQVDRRRRR